MTAYPEHEKLSKVSDDSQAIGAFLDFGLPEQGLVLYERVIRPCDCSPCKHGEPERGLHTDEELETVVEERVQITEYRPAVKPIEAILATYFEIDAQKIAEEKQAMLNSIRESNATS